MSDHTRSKPGPDEKKGRREPQTAPVSPVAPAERTQMIDSRALKHPREWAPFKFSGLRRISRRHARMVRRVEWLFPHGVGGAQVGETVKKRLSDLFDDKVSITAESILCIRTSDLKRNVSEPTFLGLLGTLPDGKKGLVEVELALSHVVIDLLLGGTGEAVALRPLTDIEEGVMTYVVLETLKAVAPTMDPALPRLRLEGVAPSVDHILQAIDEEEHLVVVQFKLVVGAHTGFLRMFLPGSMLEALDPPEGAPLRRARRKKDLAAHSARLKSVKTMLRAEIGLVEILASDLASLRHRDVVMVENISARPDLGQGGSAVLRIGRGQLGHVDADISVADGRVQATVKGVVIDQEAPPLLFGAEDDSSLAQEDGEGENAAAIDEVDSATNPHLEAKRVSEPAQANEAADLLNDVPLQLAVELGRVPITAEEIVALKVGQVIDLNRVAGEPVELSVNSRIVARGELVEVDGNLGVRVLSLVG